MFLLDYAISIGVRIILKKFSQVLFFQLNIFMVNSITFSKSREKDISSLSEFQPELVQLSVLGDIKKELTQLSQTWLDWVFEPANDPTQHYVSTRLGTKGKARWAFSNLMVSRQGYFN